MGEKGTITKKHILDSAFPLFVGHGYKAVTMQDICRASGLSKGGLYRHYKDKASLFTDLLQSFQENRDLQESEGMASNVSALRLLDEYLLPVFDRIRGGSAGLYAAIYEFCLENRENGSPSLLTAQYERGEQLLLTLINYGRHTGEFHCDAPKETAAAILFLIEGLKMCSEVMPITEEMLTGIYHQIKNLLGVSEQEP